MPTAVTPPETPMGKATPNPNTEALAGKKRKIVCFSDFDGTIFEQDTGHVLFDNYGCGAAKREELDEQIKTGARPFREVSNEMWASLHVPFDEGVATLQRTLEIDPDFKAFQRFCIEGDIPFNIISAGLQPVLRQVLNHSLGLEQAATVNIVANDADISADGATWRALWRHPDNPLGHDKAISMKEARRDAIEACGDDAVPLVVFIGDGVSDLPAAREADVLFAKKGLRLEEYCQEHKIAYIPFVTFADIQREIEKIRAGQEPQQQQQEATSANAAAAIRPNLRATLSRVLSSGSNSEFPTLKAYR